jgi:sialate O-acetylesterase
MRYAIWLGLFLMVPVAMAATRPYGRVFVESGVTDRQVLQRDLSGKASFNVSGVALPADGSHLDFRILRRSQIVEGFDWRDIPLNDDGHWAVNIAGLPTGGPFRLQFRLRDRDGNELDVREIQDVLVGDIWITTGQSNMDGCGPLQGADTPSEMVHAFSLANDWQVAEDPTMDCYESVYPVFLTSYVTRIKRNPIIYQPRGPWPTWKTEENLGTSLAVSFGKQIYESSGVPIGVIISSLGGSTIDQWSPDLKSRGGESLYGAMCLRIDKAGGRIAGVLWYQGESDCSDGASTTYAEKLTRLINAVRSDTADPNLSFYTVQIGRQMVGSEVSPAEKNAVREAQRKVMMNMRYAGLTSAIDLGMSSPAHLDSDGYKRVGRRLGRLALADHYGDTRFKPGPSFKSATLEGQKHDTLRVLFTGVTGKLRAEPRVLGFSIRTATGSQNVDYVEATLDPKAPDAILIRGVFPRPPGVTLWYGYGWNPICNVVDGADMPVPAFGPVPIEQ